VSTVVERRFPSPFEVPTPEGAEGWESMYPPYLLFSEDNREWEESRFWFLDSLHRPEVEMPFDTIVHEAYIMAAAELISRSLVVPVGNGYVNRILNGRQYLHAIPETDERIIGERVPEYTKRATYYFEHWDDIFDKWRNKLEGVIAEARSIDVPRLPYMEDESVMTGTRGYSTGHLLLSAYNRLVDNVFLVYQYHFELLVLGYTAYLNLNMFAKQAFPGIQDQTIANLTSGADILMFRPDDEVKRLAQKGVELGLADRLRADRPPQQIIAELRQDPRGQEWVAAFDAVQDPWFHFSTGTGLYHHDRAWIDDLTVPWAAMRGYLDRLERGESLERPVDQILQRRERLTAEYRGLLQSDEDRAAFDQNVALARRVAPYIEDHNMYIEHRHMTTFWNKIRDIGDRMAEHGTLEERDDLFYLNRWEVGQALYDTVNSWATFNGPSRHRLWKSTVAKRKQVVDVLRHWPAEPALGPPPPVVNDPFMLMLYGIDQARVDEWLKGSEDGGRQLQGVAGSPGVVEGKARIILSPDQLAEVEEGEILVCPITAPSWGAVFGRIKATVSDAGGIMSHTAIVSREYGLPCVVGTGRGTQLIHTGDLVRVDGDTGLVSVLS
jgi:phosphohistidine swiveling domain-containing protein